MPTSLSWHSPTLGHRAFTEPRASSPIDVKQGHPLLHMQLEPWVPSCVLYGWWFSPWELWGVLAGSYCCSSYGVANPFSSFGPFSSSFIGEPVLSSGTLHVSCLPDYYHVLGHSANMTLYNSNNVRVAWVIVCL